MTATPESHVTLPRPERFDRGEYPQGARSENPMFSIARRFGEVILAVLDRYRKDAND